MGNNKKKRTHKKKSQGPKPSIESTSQQIDEVLKDDEIIEEKQNVNAAGSVKEEAIVEEKMIQKQEDVKEVEKSIIEDKPTIQPQEEIKPVSVEVNKVPEEIKIENEEPQKVCDKVAIITNGE